MCDCFSCCSEKVRRWIFWILIAILAALTINDIVSILITYLSNPKIADMGYVYNETMKFPVFSVCIPTPMVLSIFNSSIFNKEDNLKLEDAIKKDLTKMKTSSDFLNMDWDWRTVQDAYKTLAHIHSLEREASESSIRDRLHKLNQQTKSLEKFKRWRHIIDKREVSFRAFMQKTGDEVLKRMIKKAQRSSLDSDDVFDANFRITWISEPNMCFQPIFSGNASGMITVPGNFFFMKMGHDPRKIDRSSNVVVDMNGREANMQHFEDAGGHTTEGVSSGIHSGTISDLLVEVRTVYELLENNSPGTKCVNLEKDDNEENDGGEFTPVFRCHARCRTDLIRGLCGCTPISTEYLVEDKNELEAYPVCDYSKCKIANDTNDIDEKTCIHKCRHGCTITRYNLKQLSNNPAIILNSKTHQPMQAPNQTSFFLSWGSFEFLKMEQCYKYESFVSFLSELGGSLGIWLGLSVLSLLQGSAYLTAKVTGKVKDRRKKVASTDPPSKESKPPKYSQNPFDGRMSDNPFASVTGSSGPKKRTAANSDPKK